MDGFDLVLLMVAAGSDIDDPPEESRYNPAADLNRDGMVDGEDLGLLTPKFGRSS